jgi:hypothetical protein
MADAAAEPGRRGAVVARMKSGWRSQKLARAVQAIGSFSGSLKNIRITRMAELPLALAQRKDVVFSVESSEAL